MIDAVLIGRWFPNLLTCTETSVPELALLLAAFSHHAVMDAILPGLSEVAKQPREVQLQLCERIKHVFALGSVKRGIQYCQTMVAVVVAWVTPNGTSVRRNMILSQILTAFASVHGLLQALAGRNVSHIRVLARAFKIELQMLMLTCVRPQYKPILQNLLQFILEAVFSSDVAEALSYSACMRYLEETYVGFCKARRTLSRCRDAPGYTVRVTEQFIGV